MWGAITSALQLLGILFKWLIERDAEKRAKKKKLLKEASDAFKETDPKTKASRLNSIVGRIKRM